MEYRELSPEDYAKWPREVVGTDIYNSENSKVIGAFNEKGEIVGSFTLFFCAHLEPVWIREDYRGKGIGMILGRLGNAMKALCRSMGIHEAYTVVLDTTPVLAKFAEWFGAKRVSGNLYNWKDDQVVAVSKE